MRDDQKVTVFACYKQIKFCVGHIRYHLLSNVKQILLNAASDDIYTYDDCVVESKTMCSQPCKNGGNCNQYGQCDCPPGYFGPQCQLGKCPHQ